MPLRPFTVMLPAVLIIFWFSTSVAEPSRTVSDIRGDTLTLYDAIHYALGHNQTVLYNDEQSFLAAAAQLHASASLYSPSVNFSTNIYKYYNRTGIAGAGLVGNQYATSYSQQIWPSLNLQQTLLTPLGSRVTLGAGVQTGLTGLSSFNYQTSPQFSFSYQQPLTLPGVMSGHADITSAKMNYRNSQLGFTLQRDQFELSVIQAYYQLWESVKGLAQSELDYESTKRVLQIARMKLKSGSISGFEVINLRVQNRLAEDNLEQVRNALINQAISFYQLIGDTSGMAHPGSIPALESSVPLDSTAMNVDSAVSVALRNRVEIKQAEVAIAQAKLARDQVESVSSPVLQFQTTYNLTSYYEPSVLNSFTFFPNLGWSLIASVSVPFWDGGKTAANTDEADRNIAIREENLALLKQNITLDIEERCRTLKLDLQRLKSLSLNLKAAREALEIAELRFQSGQISSTDIADVRNRYNTAENTLNQAKISCVLERAGLAEAMGELPGWINRLRRIK